ncbi:hypothetical protein [Saccharopolyspora cebuensis]|uniref:Uncharacterized protein n=1 Tax=Saccharopolyspora cebuensis TaxID=418759 RepID=A0ABV4CKU7_9PSEU
MPGFALSEFPPLALGFFGLGTGYLIWGPQELFGFPPRSPSVDRTVGTWGIWMPGFCQLVTGLILFGGLTWFPVFTEPPLYMAALAFSAYGIHWFSLGWNRYQGNDPQPNAGMAVAFALLSILGVIVFFSAGEWPVGVLFVGLTWVYLSEVFASVGKSAAERSLGLAHTLTGLWLMYLTYAAVLNLALGYQLPLN